MGGKKGGGGNSTLTRKGKKGVIWKAASFNFKRKELNFC